MAFNLVEKYKELLSSPTGQFVSGVKEGASRFVAPYAKLLSSAGHTVGAELYTRAGTSKPLLGTKLGAKLTDIGMVSAQTASELRQQQGTTGSGLTLGGAKAAFVGAGATARPMLAATALANPATALSMGLLSGGMAYGAGKLSGAFGGQPATARDIGRAVGYSPVYGGINRLTGGFQETMATDLVGKGAGWLQRGLVKGGIFGIGNILEDEVFTRLLEGRAPTGQERIIAGGTGLGGGIGAEAFSSAMKSIKGVVKKLKPDLPEKEVNVVAKRFLKNEAGRFVGSLPKKKEPVFIGDLREELGLPRHGNYIDKINIGFGIKEITESQREALKKTSLLQKSPEAPIGKGRALQQTPKTIGLDTAGRPSSKYSFNINRKKLGLEGEAAKRLDTAVEKMRPVMEGRRGKPLANEEIIKGGRKAVLLDEVIGRDEAADFGSRLQATRNFVRTASKKKGVTPEYLAQLDILSSTAADTGRKLRSFAVGAEDAGIKEAVIKDLRKLGIETERLIEAAKGVDWEDAKQVTEFYRKFKPAKLTEMLEEFRYTNMLSSPNTHIINTFSNFLQSGLVAPVQKTITGALDWTKSALTGSEREYFVGQGVDYAKGYWKSLPDAWRKFTSVVGGEAGLRKPDIDFIPTGTGRMHRLYTTPLKALEAADQFFRTMIIGGEMDSLKRTGLTGEQALKKATETAEYRLFRQGFDPEGKMGQGGMLKLWDKWNSGIANLRRQPGGKWIVPFLQTPTNILKQGVEFSPLGLATVPGAREPLEQLSKTIIGTTVFAGAYALAGAGLTTWDSPTGKKERERYYAAGLQPYSVKVGDKWVSYSKLGPLSYPIAMAAAMKWAKDNGAEENKLMTAGAGAGGFLQFFADQSYVRGIGDVIDALRGDEFKQGRALANIPSQLIPYRSLQGWFARLVDPIYRKSTGGTVPQQMWKSILSQTPILSKSLDPYTTPTGEPSMRHFPALNAVSPLKMTEDLQDISPYTPKIKKRKDEPVDIGKAFEAGAAEGLPTLPADLEVLYKDAQRTVSGYKVKSAKIRTGLTDTQTLPEAQIELQDAKTLLTRIEQEQPEMAYEFELATYKSKTVKQRTEWAIKKLGEAQDQYQHNSWVQGMLDGGVLTKGVLEALKKAGLDLNQYVTSDGEIKTYTGKKPKKPPSFAIKKVSFAKVTPSKVKKITVKRPGRYTKKYKLTRATVSKSTVTPTKLTKWTPTVSASRARI